MDRSQLAILIPAYCEEQTIANVVRQASAFGDPIVADDCSMDRTVAEAESAGAVVLRGSTNMGYEGNLNRLFSYAGEQEYSYAVTLDADGEHDPAALAQFRELLVEKKIPLVLGYRGTTQRIAEAVMGVVMRMRFGVRDILCGMKGYDMDLWRQAGIFDSTNSIGTELALGAIRNGCKFAQVSVSGTPRADQPRFDRSFTANMRIFAALGRAMFASKSHRGDRPTGESSISSSGKR